jgi:eukaryotic-like serine/threonine-protein kinase
MDDIRRQLGDRYDIERELGRGGMGAVYLARDLRLDRLVALKVLPRELAGDPSLRERFLRETRTAASFSHPNIVPVHAVEERDDLIAFAMGFVEGESLANRVRRAGPLEVRGIVRLLQDIGYALAYAHGRGVVHRDIKPDNIMLERATGRALLMDFGISRSITAKVDVQGLTRVGEVVGTPEYMSPEQASGDVVDGRSDLYALGLVALFALTGRPAISADSTQQILVKQLTELPPSATSLRPDLPASLGAAIDRCVAKEPSDRFATAEALVETIDEAQLAAPEIPIAVRLFAQEAGTLGLVLTFLVITSWLLVRTLGREIGTAWATLPAMMLVAIGFTRTLQALAAARRLADAGFTPQEVMKGLHGVVDEREGLRQQLRLSAATIRRRRITLIVAAIQLPVALLLISASLNVGFSFGTGASITSTGTGPPPAASVGTLTKAATGFSLLGVSLLLMVRSPFRTPVGERLFRLVWLGPFGRGFLRFASRGVRAAPRPASGTARVVSPKPEPPKLRGPDSMTSLEARVAALERWRDQTTR